MASFDPFLVWSCIAEPGDLKAATLVDQLGPAHALQWVLDVARGSAEALLELKSVSPATMKLLVEAATNWSQSFERQDFNRHLKNLHLLGGRLVLRTDSEWPDVLTGLGMTQPYGLWVRGKGEVSDLMQRSVSIVGARASTSYGNHVAGNIAAGMGMRGWTVVSGGAYGIDAAAHRGSQNAQSPTIAFLAGGVDRLYPAGNSQLLSSIMDVGAVISELPPGATPHRHRFLARNRLIAATQGTLVVEAAARSGALNTARSAADLGRVVGAVPGPVTSASSRGCHNLLREGIAVCVSDAGEMEELLGGFEASDTV